MKIIKICSLCIITLFFIATECFAFRCGDGLVTTGDSKTQVMVTCGKPTSKETSYSGSRGKRGKKYSGNKMEIWHYNCGSGDYIYALTFENGKLTDEATEGRGKGKSHCLGK